MRYFTTAPWNLTACWNFILLNLAVFPSSCNEFMFSFKFIPRYKSVSLPQATIHRIPKYLGLRDSGFRSTNAKFSSSHGGSVALTVFCPPRCQVPGRPLAKWASGFYLNASSSSQASLDFLWWSLFASLWERNNNHDFFLSPGGEFKSTSGFS